MGGGLISTRSDETQKIVQDSLCGLSGVFRTSLAPLCGCSSFDLLSTGMGVVTIVKYILISTAPAPAPAPALLLLLLYC